MPRPTSPPYWLSGGTETCDLCVGVHVLEMQYRCVACDRGCCVNCVVLIRESREIFCSVCRDAPEESD